MSWPVLDFNPYRILRKVLVVQLVLAGLLVAIDTIRKMPTTEWATRDLPTGPVSPGDQRRTYRTGRPNPAMLPVDGPIETPLPSELPNRLAFSSTTVDGLGRVLLLAGDIEEGDAERFENHLSDLPTKPDLVALHSPGGIVQEALKIGRTIREQELSTAVLAGSFCMSSCPYLLAGGVERIVSLEGVVGLHQHYYEQPKYLPVVFAVEGIQSGQGATMEYLMEMGIDPSLMIYSLNTPPDQIYALVETELLDTNLATEVTR